MHCQLNQIRIKYDHLTPTQKKRFIRELSSSERMTLIKCIHEDTSTAQPSILEKIKTARSIDEIQLIKKRDRNYFLIALLKIAKRIIDEIAYLCNYATAQKTYRILNQVRKPASLPSRSFLQKLLASESGNLAELLQQRGFLPKLSEITISKEYENFDFDGMTLDNCKIHSAVFKSWKKVCLSNCIIEDVCFENATLNSCKFRGCKLRQVMWNGAELKNLAFSYCSILCGSFEDASMENCRFNHSELAGTHFLQTTVAKTKMINCNLQNAIFFGKLEDFDIDSESRSTHTITMPVAALLVKANERGITVPKAFKQIYQSSSILPLRIATKAVQVDQERLNGEVTALLTEFKQAFHDLLNAVKEREDQYPECSKIFQKAEILSQDVDAFFLPGGEDLSPALYGAKETEGTCWDNDYRRTFLELCIIYKTLNKGIPLMAVCRGFQIYNVYFGAKLLQNVKGHENLQELEANKMLSLGLYNEATQEVIVGKSAHHQGIPVTKAPQTYLETVMEYRGIVKASEAKDGGCVPAILLQFHPEYTYVQTATSWPVDIYDNWIGLFVSKNNRLFFKILRDSAIAYRNKKNFLRQIESQAAAPLLDA